MAEGLSKGAAKGPEAFRTISEASSELGVPQHVLRFWETKFSFIRPMKRAGGRRFYRKQDIAVLKGVRILLHEEGYTIKGVQRLHKEQGVRRLVGAGEGDIPSPAATRMLTDLNGPPSEPELFELANDEPTNAGMGEGTDPASVVGDAAIIKSGARARLEAVLRDIEAVKADIDGLLAKAGD